MPKTKTIIKREVKKKTPDIKTEVYGLNGKVVSSVNLPGEIFGVKVSPMLITQAVKVYLANQRLGTHSSKTRSMVSGSSRKIYRQKGTGRARHGDIKAPIFVGGGVAHGPHPFDHSLSMPSNMRRVALFGVLSEKLSAGKLKVVSGFAKASGKTKEIAGALVKLIGEKKKGRTMLLTPNKINSLYLAGRNIERFTLREANLANAYEVLKNNEILLMEESIETLVKTFLGPKKEKNGIKKEKKVQEKKAAVKIISPKKTKTPVKTVKKITKKTAKK